jgi:hypothetical protein
MRQFKKTARNIYARSFIIKFSKIHKTIEHRTMNSIYQLDQKTFNNLFSNFDIEKDFSI